MAIPSIDFGLSISCRVIARDKMRLVREGFTHVINCAQGKRFGQVDTDEDFYAETGINYLGIPGHDSVKFDISKHFKEAADFMKSCENGKFHFFLVQGSISYHTDIIRFHFTGKILVHCHQGISRSAAVTVACLVINHNMTVIEALCSIMQHRLVMPNKGFIRRLAIFQDSLGS